MLNFKSYYDLSRDIAANIQKLPQVDMVVGVPKSGLIPATMIASFLNVSMIDLDSFLFSFSKRKGVRKQRPTAQTRERVLIVDDSVNTGNETRRVRQRIADLQDDFDFTICAVYGVTPGAHDEMADVVLTHVPHPRFFQWNYRNHIVAEHACFDMDGVLCVDPPEDKNDDGELYRDYILNAPPLFIPAKKIKAIVTSRLERFRPETEEWLRKHRVAYDELIMLDLPTAVERRRLRAHAPFKSEVYAARPDDLLFVESNWKQAKAIALATDKPVICTENDCYLAGAESAREAERTKRLFSYDQIGLETELRLENARLSEALTQKHPMARQRLSELEDHAASRKRSVSPLEKETAVQRTLRAPQRPQLDIPPKTQARRVLMISRTFDARVGAGAAVSSARLRDAMTRHGAEVFSLSTDDLEISHDRKAWRPISAPVIGFWSHLHDAEHARVLRDQIDLIDPDVVVLGAIDNGIASTIDIAFIDRPMVWITRDNWAHTGGCLFKLEPDAVRHEADVPVDFMKALTCTGYMSGCEICPALTHPEEQRTVASFQYMNKSMVLEYRRDIVFAPISDWLNRTLASAPLTEGHMIATVRNPVDLTAIRRLDVPKSALRGKLDLPVDVPLVLLNAHSLRNPRKGLGPVLAALAAAPRLDDVHFVTVGQSDLNDIPAELKDRFHSFGFVEAPESLVEIFNAVDAVLVPALQESLSVVASDANACGTPVICFEVGGLTELVDHKVNGWLAPGHDTANLLEGLAWVLFDADRQALSDACLRKASEVLDEATNVQTLFAVMDAAVEKHKDLGPPPDALVSVARMMSEMHRYQVFQRQHMRTLEKRARSGAAEPRARASKPRLGFVVKGTPSTRHLTQIHRVVTAFHQQGEKTQTMVRFEDPAWADTTWAGKHLKTLDYISIVEDTAALSSDQVIEIEGAAQSLTFRTTSTSDRPDRLNGDAEVAHLPYFLSPALEGDLDRIRTSSSDRLVAIAKSGPAWMAPMGRSGFQKASIHSDGAHADKLIIFGAMSENDLFESVMIARHLGRMPWRVTAAEFPDTATLTEIGEQLVKIARQVNAPSTARPGLLSRDLQPVMAQLDGSPGGELSGPIPASGL